MTIKTIIYMMFIISFSINLKAKELDEYQVEILLFSQKDISVNESELFEKIILIPDTENSLSLPPLEIAEDVLLEENISAAPIIINDLAYDEVTDIHPADAILAQLTEVQRSINRSSYYKLLSHTAWRQLGLDNDGAQKIRITHGDAFVVLKHLSDEDINDVAFDYLYLLKEWEKYNNEQQIDNAKILVDKLSLEDDDSDNSVEVPPALPEDLLKHFTELNLSATIMYPLDGTIKVVRTRYLHMYTDLVWTIALPLEIEKTDEVEATDEIEETFLIDNAIYLDGENLQSAVDDTPTSFIEPLQKLNLQSYAFKSHRKMRSKKQHYIDHPKLGLVTVIMPVLKETKKIEN